MKKAIVAVVVLAGLTGGVGSIADAAPSTKAKRHGVNCAAESRKGGPDVAKGARTAFSRCVTAAAQG